MKLLSEKTGAAVPPQLAGIFAKEIRHKDVIECDEMKQYVIDKASAGEK